MSGDDLATPSVKTRSGPSIVWLIPVLTLLVGAWLLVTTISDQGPVVQLSFKTAEGIEVGKTKVKYKSVDIGVVQEVRFAPDFDGVVLTVQFNQDTDHFLRRNTRFWVVRPQLSVRGVSGLSTLVSGSYIEIDPGPGASQRFFVGLEKQPVITGDAEGTAVTLVTDNLGSLDTGSPLYYRGILAGEVLGHELGSDRRSVFVHLFVRAPFDQLVRGNSRFWNVSGVDVSMDANGFRVQTESVQSMLFGGISFDTPDSLERDTDDIGDLVFTLYSGLDAIAAQTYTQRLTFVLYFDGSVRGLNPGAPVEFKGIRIGEVTDVRLEFDARETSFRIPVLVELEPERIIDRDPDSGVPAEETLRLLVERGLRARLQSGSLLTGQLYVELNMYPDTEIRLVADAGGRYPELPTIPNTVEAITRTVEGFVAQLDDVHLDEIAAALQGTLEGTEALTNGPELKQALASLGPAMASLRGILADVDEADLDATLAAAQGVVENLERTIELTNDALQPGSPLQYNVIQLTGELEAAARAIRALVESLQREPQSLLFGRPGEER
ncbi:MAG TPA: MlaD family protein [Pseudomonadales bacterium]|nr:MlaD family protein [Pseudomonadales bacterium]